MNITKNQEGETQQNRHNRNIPVPSRPIWGITRVLAFKTRCYLNFSIAITKAVLTRIV